ncbi:MAG: ABC-2 transporter permease [Erysipelotrichaceae bacterium]|nr:ABC-2 transporter permease [Erysipelotrichaceae bacterium]
MKGLLVKDLRLLLSQSRFYIILLIVLFVSGTSTQATFVSGYIAVVFPMFAVSTISYDEYDNGNAFLFTLPFSRKEYVLAKYIFGLLLCVFGNILGT